MKSLLTKQAIVIPLAAMLVPILIAFSLPGYSSISQHISEVAMLDHPIAPIQRIAAVVTGISILLFGLAVLLARFFPAPLRERAVCRGHESARALQCARLEA